MSGDRETWKKDVRMRSGIEAAAYLGGRIYAGPVSEDEAGRILAGMLPGDWEEESDARRKYCTERARSLLLLASRRTPIYDEEAENGRIWHWCHWIGS